MVKIGDILNKKEKARLYESVRKHVLNLPNVKSNSWDSFFVIIFLILVSDKKIRQCYHLFMLIFKENKDAYGFRNHLIKNSIYASFHYIPLHLSSFSNQIIKKTKLPITEKIYKKIVRIPLHPSIQIKDAKFMINKIKTFLEN